MQQVAAAAAMASDDQTEEPIDPELLRYTVGDRVANLSLDDINRYANRVHDCPDCPLFSPYTLTSNVIVFV